MAELECSPENSLPISDYEMIYYLKRIIAEVMFKNDTYVDYDDLAYSAEFIYPVIAHIVFNAHFQHIRRNEKKLVDLITYLVTNLS